MLQKTAEIRRYLIGNKTADKITSVGKTKSKERNDEIIERQENLHTTRKKRHQIIDDLRLP